MTGPDWWRPTGEPGRAEVRELLSPDAWHRYFAEDPGIELELGRAEVGELVLDLGARSMSRFVRAAGAEVVVLDVSGPPDFSGGWQKAVRVLDGPGEALLRTDETRPSRLRGALRYLLISTATRSWVWHFEGGRTAGERLVLSRGEEPGGPPLVETWPASHGRSLGSLRGGATVDTHVTCWGAEASAAEVALAELLAVSRLDRLVDYRPTRIASGFGELIDLLPRAEPGTE
jgi:hypothetical protein